ncbi:MAG: type III pantothenate kinase [Bacteroidales bacterium]|nr:type III pantothenate kinase [Bacteroidales bacterium]
MNLIIDQGNTRAKLALFDGLEIISSESVEEVSQQMVEDFIGNHSIAGVIVSTVTKLSDDFMTYIQSIAPLFVELSHETPLPFTIHYRTPETLGRDRIAAVAGAYFAYPNRNILVIDAGTAITYDFINSKGIYLGGNIAPGLEMRLTALHTFTDKLPLVGKTGEVPTLGYNTETAIRSGVIEGIVYEIDGYSKQISKDWSELLIFLTGGDTFYFDKRLKNVIFADEYLVTKGLNRILQYNAK